MAFTQQTFLGASIRGWTSSIGWGSEPSQMTVQLVEDTINGDIFTSVDPGLPVQFLYNTWYFNGIVQNIKTRGDSSGSPLFEVTIIDPRQILEGVQIILSGYNSGVNGLSNLFNVYGYLESSGFGGSHRNEAGIPYYKIVEGLIGISTGSSTTYGKYITYRGVQYSIDLSNLPPVDRNYRIGVESISAMDFVREICTLGGSEDSFFFRLESNNVIKLYVLDRNKNPVTGAISRFIISTPGAVHKEIGIEGRNQTTSKFLVGGDVEQIFLQTPNGDNIQNFWGIDADYNLVIPYEDDYGNEVFTVDSRRINIPGMGPTYTTDVNELRAALDSRESWEFFLAENNDVDGPHKGKANALGIVGNLGSVKEFMQSLIVPGDVNATIQKMKNVTPLEFSNFTKDALQNRNSESNSEYEDIDENIGILYSFVSSYATEYYGKKLLIKIPHLYTYTEDETANVVLSQEPIDAGYIEEQYWDDAAAINILPWDTEPLTTSENKIQAYVRFDNAENLDLSEFSPTDLIFSRTTHGSGGRRNSQGLSVFIRCSVDQKIYFVNYNTKYSPRAVIELPGCVRPYNGEESNRYNGVFANILRDLLAANNLQDAFTQIFNSYSNKFGADILFFGHKGEALYPDLVGLPLLSKVNSYGPWYASGADGKTEYQKDSQLVPWNYAGYEVMNLAGSAAVNNAISSQFISEAGSIEFPDVPAINIGDLLIFGGPYITDVNVSIGRGGATTTYRMQNWTTRFGRVPQSMVDRIQRMALAQQRLRKEQRQKRSVALVNVARTQKLYRENLPNRKKHNSSNSVIVGEVTKDDDRSIVSVFFQPAYNSIDQVANNYNNKAIASLDSLFVPFSTKYTYDGDIPHFESPTGTTPNLENLNPFKDTHLSTVMSHGDQLPEDLRLRLGGYESGSNYRALALRAPVVLAGWGYDTEGNPVPGDGTNFDEDYKVKVENYKVGPLDVRWDNDKKVWAAGGGSQLIRATYIGNSQATLSSSSQTVNVEEWLGGPMCSGQKIFLSQEGSRYYVVNIQYSALDVVTDVTCDDDTTTVCKRTVYLPSAYSDVSCEGIS